VQSIGLKTMGAETHVTNWTLKQWEQKHRIKWNLVETMGANHNHLRTNNQQKIN